MKSLSQNVRECEEIEDYHWGDCLDEMFYLRKGCQDPWNVNQKVPLRVCTNITEIQTSYRRGPLLDRPVLGPALHVRAGDVRAHQKWKTMQDTMQW